MYFIADNNKGGEIPVIINDSIFHDSRGSFRILNTIDDSLFHVDQLNVSVSKPGVFRGMHWQKGEASQAKIITVLKGRVIDFVLDLRPELPTFKNLSIFNLDAKNGQSLYVPHGFAHGFINIADEESVFMYAVDSPYNPEADFGCKFDSIGGRAGEISENYLKSLLPNENQELIISEKDLNLPPLNTILDPSLFPSAKSPWKSLF